MSNKNTSPVNYIAVPDAPPAYEEDENADKKKQNTRHLSTDSQLDPAFVEKLPAYDGYHHLGLVDFDSR
jgi:hypothetical protein